MENNVENYTVHKIGEAGGGLEEAKKELSENYQHAHRNSERTWEQRETVQWRKYLLCMQ